MNHNLKSKLINLDVREIFERHILKLICWALIMVQTFFFYLRHSGKNQTKSLKIAPQFQQSTIFLAHQFICNLFLYFSSHLGELLLICTLFLKRLDSEDFIPFCFLQSLCHISLATYNYLLRKIVLQFPSEKVEYLKIWA